jgi:SAM-dependent methyltransferase
MSDGRIDWENLYKASFTPWDVKRPDSHLMEIIKTTPMQPCRVLEIGCGTGTNAIWLAGQGFRVTAIDMSESALKIAREKKGIEQCDLLLYDFLDKPFPENSFDFVFDLGCFHGFANPADRDLFARRVAGCLSDAGYWFSICSCTDGPAVCPTRLSARDITSAVEPCFEIQSITSGYLDDLSSEDKQAMGIELGLIPRAWFCLMKKRSTNQ